MHEDGRFSGDMDRNEVEMDLKKFMAMVEEIGALKDTLGQEKAKAMTRS